MWEKLSNVQEEVLDNYLKNEYPQTIAVVLGQAPAGGMAARVDGHPAGGPGAPTWVNRMLKMEEEVRRR